MVAAGSSPASAARLQPGRSAGRAASDGYLAEPAHRPVLRFDSDRGLRAILVAECKIRVVELVEDRVSTIGAVPRFETEPKDVRSSTGPGRNRGAIVLGRAAGVQIAYGGGARSIPHSDTWPDTWPLQSSSAHSEAARGGPKARAAIARSCFGSRTVAFAQPDQAGSMMIVIFIIIFFFTPHAPMSIIFIIFFFLRHRGSSW